MWHRMAGRWIHQHRDGWQGALNTQGFGLRGAPMWAGVQTTVGRMPNMPRWRRGSRRISRPAAACISTVAS